MVCQDDFPWAAIHEFLFECGRAGSPQDLAVKALEGIDQLIPYDQGRVYLLDANGTVISDYLHRVDRYWPEVYYDYYSQILDGKYSAKNKNIVQSADLLFPNTASCVFFDWTNRPSDEFVTDYIRAQKISYSLGFGYYDSHNVCKRTCSIDRTSRRARFSKREMDMFALLTPHLENLNRNFYIGAGDECMIGKVKSTELLTRRESEIADMLCQGFIPEKIASCLYLSRATVYKHIANLHAKLNVSSRQELVLKLLHDRVR
jgi:DNA-binding CsgD family transcriptional regulator